MPSRRPERVSELLLQAVAEVLLREVKDPRVSGVTLTGVTVSPDLKLAKIFFLRYALETKLLPQPVCAVRLPILNARLLAASIYATRQICSSSTIRLWKKRIT